MPYPLGHAAIERFSLWVDLKCSGCRACISKFSEALASGEVPCCQSLCFYLLCIIRNYLLKNRKFDHRGIRTPNLLIRSRRFIRWALRLLECVEMCRFEMLKMLLFSFLDEKIFGKVKLCASISTIRKETAATLVGAEFPCCQS